MFIFIKSWVMTLFYFIGGIMLLADVSRCTSPKEPGEKAVLQSAGPCGLPGVLVRSELSEGTGHVKICTLRIPFPDFDFADGSGGSRASTFRCEVKRYRLEGRWEFADIEIGTRWRVFPIRQNELVCKVVMLFDEWERLVSQPPRGMLPARGDVGVAPHGVMASINLAATASDAVEIPGSPCSFGRVLTVRPPQPAQGAARGKTRIRMAALEPVACPVRSVPVGSSRRTDTGSDGMPSAIGRTCSGPAFRLTMCAFNPS